MSLSALGQLDSSASSSTLVFERRSAGILVHRLECFGNSGHRPRSWSKSRLRIRCLSGCGQLFLFGSDSGYWFGRSGANAHRLTRLNGSRHRFGRLWCSRDVPRAVRCRATRKPARRWRCCLRCADLRRPRPRCGRGDVGLHSRDSIGSPEQAPPCQACGDEGQENAERTGPGRPASENATVFL